MAVLTNGWNPMQQCKAERAGLRGTVLVSSEIGVQKPAQRAFEILLSTLKTPPGATLYLGDDPRGDMAGAAAAGCKRRGSTGSGRRTLPTCRHRSTP